MTSYASLVIEHIVPIRQRAAFRKWHANLTKSARLFEGYIRTDLCPPIQGMRLRWYSIIHFDSAEHLNNWVRSGERERLIELGQKTFESYQFKSFSTGLEGWFSPQTGLEQIGLNSPPAWKQNLAVLLGLYPTVMILMLGSAALGFVKYWPLANSMLVSNLLSCSLMTWVMMPNVSRLMNFWMQPNRESNRWQTDVLGILIIAVLLTLMVEIFKSF